MMLQLSWNGNPRLACCNILICCMTRRQSNPDTQSHYVSNVTKERKIHVSQNQSISVTVKRSNALERAFIRMS